MTLADGLLSGTIILLLFYIIYTKMKDQTLKDTLDEIKDLITSPVQEEEYFGI